MTPCGCFPGAGSTRRHVLMAMASALLPSFAFAQEKLYFDVSSSCSFFPGDMIAGPVYHFQSTPEALEIVARITHAVGLEPNFELLQANIPNAAAIIQDQKRYILYSLVFMEKIRQSTATDWAALTILAHEVGHHLNGHTLSASGSRPTLELQADAFAGHAVKRIGGALDDALAVYQGMQAEGTDTHPPRSARLEAVTRGWIGASASPEAALPVKAAAGSAAKDPDALARAIIDQALTTGKPSPGLNASIADEANDGFARLKRAGPGSTIREQGKHRAADGNLYYLYEVKAGGEALNCILGLDESGTLSVFHCQ